ncbi:MAG TPA: cupin domain-containing protein [Dongiaceae bacterium]|jgi:uncharacterized cupin superfamily protein|nr:cupin domain-containing protein [Dongiaceae bacterium]
MTASRLAFVRHHTEIEQPEGDGDLRATIAHFGRALGLVRLGVNQEIVPPGCRTSIPHAHSLEEEFVFVIEGRPDLWIDGEIHPLRPGDGIAFPAGAGIAHCLINNTDRDVRLLIVGENIAGDRVAYPIDPAQRRPGDDWTDAPRHPLGAHKGRANRPRQ